MGSPLGPTLANIFLCKHEENWLDNCPHSFKPLFYRRYVDDTFLIFKEPQHIELFLHHLNSQHPNIKFTSEVENNKSISFLDIKMYNNPTGFTTEVYRKPTYTGLGLNFLSFIPEQFKINCIKTLLNRAYNITTTWKSFHEEITFLNTFFKNNNFPLHIVSNQVRSFLNYKCNQKSPVPTVPRDVKYIKLPFYGHTSYKIRKELLNTLKHAYPAINFRIIFNNTFTIGSLFKFKDEIPTMLQSNVCYKYECSGCNAGYIGSTIRNLHTRICEHIGISNRTLYPLSTPAHSKIREHSEQTDHPIEKTNFTIIGRNSDSLSLRIAESLHIKLLKPELNSCDSSIPLYTV